MGTTTICVSPRSTLLFLVHPEKLENINLSLPWDARVGWWRSFKKALVIPVSGLSLFLKVREGGGQVGPD